MTNIDEYNYKDILRLYDYTEGNHIDLDLELDVREFKFFKCMLKLCPEIINKIYTCKAGVTFNRTIFSTFSFPGINFEDYLDLIFKYNVHFRIVKCEIYKYGGISNNNRQYTNILFRHYFAARYKRILISYWLSRRIRQIKHRYIVALLLKSRIRMFNIIDELIDFLKD